MVVTANSQASSASVSLRVLKNHVAFLERLFHGARVAAIGAGPGQFRSDQRHLIREYRGNRLKAMVSIDNGLAEEFGDVVNAKRIVVAEYVDADASDEVESFVAVGVPDMTALRFDDVIGQAACYAEVDAIFVHVSELQFLNRLLIERQSVVRSEEIGYMPVRSKRG